MLEVIASHLLINGSPSFIKISQYEEKFLWKLFQIMTSISDNLVYFYLLIYYLYFY